MHSRFSVQYEVKQCTDVASQGYKHLFVLGLVEHIGKAALAAVLQKGANKMLSGKSNILEIIDLRVNPSPDGRSEQP